MIVNRQVNLQRKRSILGRIWIEKSQSRSSPKRGPLDPLEDRAQVEAGVRKKLANRDPKWLRRRV